MATGAPAALCVMHVDGWVYAHTLFDSSANYRSAVVHGELRHMTEHARLARSLQVPQAIVLQMAAAQEGGGGTPAVATKIHQPRVLHQSPCRVPGTRRMNATPLPVRSALAGHMITCWRKKAMLTSSTAHELVEAATDPYQPAEGRYRLMPGILTARRAP